MPANNCPNLRAPALALLLAVVSAYPLHADDLSSRQTLAGEFTCELALSPQPHFVFHAAPKNVLADPQGHLAIHVVRSAKPATTQDGPVTSPKSRTPTKLLGTFQRRDERIEFKPQFTLSANVIYAVQYTDSKDTPQPLHFQLPQLPLESPVIIESIFPSTNRLPENLLKFYIHFSRPMRRGEAYQHIKLYKDDTLIESPFLELGEELWNRQQTRFTLFIHPGRIKRGLKPRRDDGPSLAEGNTYRFEISQSWHSPDGQQLAKPYVKEFEVGPADHTGPDPASWKINTPPTETRQPVSLDFAEPLDHAMLHRVFRIVDIAGDSIPGNVTINASSDNWSFTPTEDWATGAYSIIVQSHLEDLCGNSIARPFETSLQADDTAEAPSTIAVEFIVK